MSANPDKKKGKLPRFGKLNAARPRLSQGPPPAPKGMKRSTKVALAMAGTAAIVTYMATREPVCKPANPNDWNAPANPQPCRQSSRTSSSGGGAWRWSSGQHLDHDNQVDIEQHARCGLARRVRCDRLIDLRTWG